MQMKGSRRRRLRIVLALACLTLVALALPWPGDWRSFFTNRQHARAIFSAYRVAVRTPRSSNVPVTGATYTAIIHDRSREEIEVSFLPRQFVTDLVSGEPPEEINVVLHRRSNAVRLVYFGE